MWQVQEVSYSCPKYYNSEITSDGDKLPQFPDSASVVYPGNIRRFHYLSHSSEIGALSLAGSHRGRDTCTNESLVQRISRFVVVIRNELILLLTSYISVLKGK